MVSAPHGGAAPRPAPSSLPSAHHHHHTITTSSHHLRSTPCHHHCHYISCIAEPFAAARVCVRAGEWRRAAAASPSPGWRAVVESPPTLAALRQPSLQARGARGQGHEHVAHMGMGTGMGMGIQLTCACAPAPRRAAPVAATATAPRLRAARAPDLSRVRGRAHRAQDGASHDAQGAPMTFQSASRAHTECGTAHAASTVACALPVWCMHRCSRRRVRGSSSATPPPPWACGRCGRTRACRCVHIHGHAR